MQKIFKFFDGINFIGSNLIDLSNCWLAHNVVLSRHSALGDVDCHDVGAWISAFVWFGVGGCGCEDLVGVLNINLRI